jgi:chromosome segregation ATPase
MSILDNSQDALNSARKKNIEGLDSSLRMNQNRLAQEQQRVANERTQRAADRQQADEELAMEAEVNASLSSRVADLKVKLEEAEHKIAEQDAAIKERDKALDDWVVSQTAFRNLLSRFGKMPDGTPFSNLPKDEQRRYIDGAHDEIQKKRTQDHGL